MSRSWDALVWFGLLAAAWNAGRFAARWNAAPMLSKRDEWAVFVAGLPVLLSWATLCGALLRENRTLPLVASLLGIDVPPLYRVAAVSSGAIGATLTACVGLSLAAIATAGSEDPQLSVNVRARRLALLSTSIALLLAVTLFTPRSGQPTQFAPSIPLSLLHPGAALHGMLLVAALAQSGVTAVTALSLIGQPATPESSAHVRRGLHLAWVLASLALAADQWARSAMTSPAGATGAAPRGVLGVVLWTTLGLLVFWRGSAGQVTKAGRAWPVRMAFGGAVCLAVAFAAHIVAKRTALQLSPGQTSDVRDSFGRRWRLVNQGVSRFDAGGRDITAAAVEVTSAGGETRLLSPAQRLYLDASGQSVAAPVAVRGVRRGALQDLLVTLEGVPAGDDQVQLRVAFVPLAILWLPGLVLLITGSALLSLPRGA